MSLDTKMAWNVRLLTGSYSPAADGVVIELFGKTDDNRSITIRYEGFRPYVYILEPLNATIAELSRDPEIISIEKKKLFFDGKEREFAKVTMKYPWRVPAYRRKYHDDKFFAADIPFHFRFIYDMNLGSCVKVIGSDVSEKYRSNYTTELVVNAEKFEPIEPFKPALKILSFDIENSIKTGEIYTICCVIRTPDGRLLSEQLTGTEKEIICGFIELIKKYDPDVITGYNIDNYDIPLLIERAKKQGIDKLMLGRELSVVEEVSEQFWRAHGRILADAWWCAKLELRPKQETLNYLAKILLNERKEEVDPKKIDAEWQKNREKVIRYCIRDAELALRILEKLNVLDKAMDLATVSKLPVDDVLNGRTSTLIDSILIRAADRNNVAVPMMRHEYKSEGIEGGYVHTIEPGLYHWVVLLDFKSMYPSVIISNNICFTTLSEDGELLSPTGVRFLSKEQKKGLLPEILEQLMREREEIKLRMKNAPPDKKRYYDGLQQAIKTLMNAFYGVFASSFYRFTNPKIGASITAFARENIKNVIKTLEVEGTTTIYSDTDSIFIRSPSEGLENAVKFGQATSERFSKGGLVLEFDKVIEPMFSHGKKKRYVGMAVWPKNELLVRGYEIRRTDSFDYQSEALMAVFEDVLRNNPESAVRTARMLVTNVLEGKVEIEKLVISRTCRAFESYKDPDSMVNVQVAKKLQAEGYEFVPGMKVSWIVTNAKKTPQEVEPYIASRQPKAKPDWNYYALRVASTLGRVTEVFGWDERALFAGVRQKTLVDEESFEPEVDETPEEPRPKELKKRPLEKEKAAKKTMRLEDFA